MSTWLITGCSTGLGRALAGVVVGAGHNVVVTARDVARVEDIAGTMPSRVLAVALDVTDSDQCASSIRKAEERPQARPTWRWPEPSSRPMCSAPSR